MKKIILFLAAIVMQYFAAMADSPLTSTPFWEVYQKEKIIIKAQKAGGILTTELADFLISKKGKIDVKMALINCLSWNLNGKKNSVIFLNRLLEKNIYKTSSEFREKGSAEHLLCMAYLKAMDDYFTVTEALDWAEMATTKNSGSYTFAIIHALIKAQFYFDDDWCNVWQSTNQVRENRLLKQDMKPQAIEIIFTYMDLYREYCQ